MFTAPADQSFLTSPLTARAPRRVLPKSGLELTVVGTTRVLARSPGKLPSPAELHARNCENIRPLSPEESARIFAAIERMVGPAQVSA